ncbi:transcriptional regulator protein [Micromonospora sp. NPDC018662]|uniref:transcriptional regulator protein n=1 Tax=Micromonospora sp. NPDC018662 TaxID=3364238 RepID=UPI0037A26CD0
MAVSTLLPADSPRLDGEDERHVRLLAELVPDLPPILVHRGSMRVIDGMHRLRATQLRGHERISVQFFDGDEVDAFVRAVRLNIAHGLPLTVADRRAAAVRILGAYPHRADRWIARSTGLAPSTVAAIRADLGRAGGPQPTGRIGRDGRVRPLSSAHARRLASEVIARRPDASLREVAQEVGVSPSTVRDVRERLRRGEDPVPAGAREAAHAHPLDRLGDCPTDSGPRRMRYDGHPPPDVAPAEKNGPALLHSLSRDPSVRFSEPGRALLRTMFVQNNGPHSCEGLMDQLPPHVAFVVAEVARSLARQWSDLAQRLEHRLRASA